MRISDWSSDVCSSDLDVELDADEDGWLVTDGDFPAIRAEWHEGAAGEPGRLDVDVVLSEERRIEESFAGIGAGVGGCREALPAFEQNVFPVPLAGGSEHRRVGKEGVSTLKVRG